MRIIKEIKSAYFTKNNDELNIKNKDFSNWEEVSLPHTWNNLDGQSGEGDYYRGVCWYSFLLPSFSSEKEQFIEFQGVNHVADVYCNGVHIGIHKGGFSTFRFEITDLITQGQENYITLSVNNSEELNVYPQHADFTFFGGIYRTVNFIEVSKIHFDLMVHGSQGVFITPEVKENFARVRVNTFCNTGEIDAKICCEIVDRENNIVGQFEDGVLPHNDFFIDIKDPILWDGIEKPYLYCTRLKIKVEGDTWDTLEVEFGIRTFIVDPEKGFFLNGREYKLHGVSRHQDRLDKGWTLSKEDHEEDMELIKQVGANTIRLAHYQHDSYFYDLCDKNGMVIWAEIPFITVFNETQEAYENTLSQMKELVVQNYNHPSICFWGISNEISMGGDSEKLVENLKQLNKLVKEIDPSRLTTMAQVMMLEMDSEHNFITDILAYNLYMGWYVSNVHENGPWFDKFHEKYPERPLGLSEYGAEAVLKWHSTEPKIKDYSEEYQAYYHEQMLEIFSTRPFLWATYVWNMFDFAANARDEGGVKGRNNKGLVTYDRKIKKDSFYAYKSWWSKEKFVHVAGERFVDRVVDKTDIKVYSNCDKITLCVNGNEVDTLEGEHVFIFKDVKINEGENKITAKCECCCEHSIVINGVTKANENYILPQVDDSEEVKNWFAHLETKQTQIEIKEGFYSVKDNLAELMENTECSEIIMNIVAAAFGKSMAKTSISMMGPAIKKMTVQDLVEFAGDKVPENAIIMLNEKLNKIKK